MRQKARVQRICAAVCPDSKYDSGRDEDDTNDMEYLFAACGKTWATQEATRTHQYRVHKETESDQKVQLQLDVSRVQKTTVERTYNFEVQSSKLHVLSFRFRGEVRNIALPNFETFEINNETKCKNLSIPIMFNNLKVQQL